MTAPQPVPAAGALDGVPDISIVIPCFDEGANIVELVRSLRAAFPPHGPTRAEFVLVDDGSGDGTAALLHRLARTDGRIVPVIRQRRGGQTAALRDGLRSARGTWVAHLDGDLQNDPADLPAMLETARGDFDAVVGFRVQRRDRWSRRAASVFAGLVRRAVLHDTIRDIGCSTRVVRREALAALPDLPDVHRYIPALLERAGWRIAQVPARHYPRRHGKSKYSNLARGARGLVDLARVARAARRLGGLPRGRA